MKRRKYEKGRLFLLLLLTVFFVGITGRLLLSEQKATTVSLTLTIRSSAEELAVLEHLPLQARDATLDGIPVHILSLSVRPALRTELRPEGGAVTYPSALTARLYATVSLEGEIREGHFFAKGIYLPVGKEATLSSDSFFLTVCLLQVEKE